jgi:hypothetical protein
MKPFWIDAEIAKLAIIPRPRGGDWLEDDLRALKKARIDVIVSALTQEENEELELSGEGALCRSNSIEFLSFRIADRSVPESEDAFGRFLTRLQILLERRRGIGVHCRAGIGRSSMIVAGVLIRQGLPCASAFALIEKARGCSVPDIPEQRAWMEKFGSDERGHGDRTTEANRG